MLLRDFMGGGTQLKVVDRQVSVGDILSAGLQYVKALSHYSASAFVNRYVVPYSGRQATW